MQVVCCQVVAADVVALQGVVVHPVLDPVHGRGAGRVPAGSGTGSTIKKY